MASPVSNDVLKRFNRDTAYLAVGLLAVLFLTAVALATLVPEQYSKTADFTPPTSQGQSSPLVNANLATLLGTDASQQEIQAKKLLERRWALIRDRLKVLRE
jgi:hypothetical protein